MNDSTNLHYVKSKVTEQKTEIYKISGMWNLQLTILLENKV